MTYSLGVDLGTTFTAVAIGWPNRTEMVSLGNRSIVVPSVIFAGRNGQLLTGDAADRQAVLEPDRAAREFKRRLGDPTPIVLGEAPFSPVALLAATLSDAVESASRVQGSPPQQIVLTRPAVWGPYRLEQFDEVPRLAGLDNVHVVTEPVAAATYYAAGRRLSDGDVIAVYDLGGGTFDTAILRMEAGEARILGNPEGVEWLGGSDFDEAILQYVDSELHGAISEADPRDHDSAVALGRLRQECVLAKESLSADNETTIPVFLPDVRKDVHLTRAQFEDMIQPSIGYSVEAIRRALSSAEVKPADLSAVLLAGGSSRIPLVARTIEAALGRPTVVDAHPKHVVALGAAQIATALLTPAALPPPATPRPATAGTSGEVSADISADLAGMVYADASAGMVSDDTSSGTAGEGSHSATATATVPRTAPDAAADSRAARSAGSMIGWPAFGRVPAAFWTKVAQATVFWATIFWVKVSWEVPGSRKGLVADSTVGTDDGGENHGGSENGGADKNSGAAGTADPGQQVRARHRRNVLAGVAGVMVILAGVAAAVAVDRDHANSSGLASSAAALTRTSRGAPSPTPPGWPLSIPRAPVVTSSPTSKVARSRASRRPADRSPAPPAAPAEVAPAGPQAALNDPPAPRATAAAAAPAAAAAAPAAAAAAPAPAAQPPTSWNLVSVSTGLCLDSNDAGSAYTLACNGGNYQRWRLVQANGGYHLRDLRTGRCMGARSNPPVNGTVLKGTVFTATCGSQTNLVWARSANAFGDQFANAATGQCLDNNVHGNAYTQACNGGNYQHWIRRS